jgi:hypothetical protein
MKNSQDRLFKLAAKFQRKYAQGQSLKEIIQNAASYGESSQNGIMNFPAQLKKDQADMNINVTVSSGMMGGTNVEVSQPSVDPPQFASNYARLPQQIQKYLDRYIKDFPQITPGTHTLEFTGRSPSDSGIATLPQ